MKKINSTNVLKRLDALSANAISDVPDIVFISPDRETWSVDERYYSSRGNKTKRFTVNSPDEYERKGGIVFIDDLDRDD